MASLVIHEATHLAHDQPWLQEVKEWVPELASWFYRAQFIAENHYVHTYCCTTDFPSTWDPRFVEASCPGRNSEVNLGAYLGTDGVCYLGSCAP
jgi:hypothetical protein